MENWIEQLGLLEWDDVVIIDGIPKKPEIPLNQLICEEVNRQSDINMHPAEINRCIFIGPENPGLRT